MKKAKKVLLLVLCAVLLVGVSVAGTVAYLTSQDEVVNTFTVGQVAIELHETDEETRNDQTVGLDLHLLPGIPVDKDPTVTVKEDSEDSYVRVNVTVSDVEKLKAAFEGLTYSGVHGEDLPYVTDGMFNLHLIVEGWSAEDWAFESYNNGVYEFRYVGELAQDGVIPKNENADTELPALFTKVVLPTDMTNALIENLEDVTITVTAEAIQADGFVANGEKTAADAAWEAFGD